MAELVREHPALLKDASITYTVEIWAEQRVDKTWAGWLEFRPAELRAPVLRTAQETSQPSRVTIEYWAFGLEPIYLEGALARARAGSRVKG